ncbi:unnamed protein product, partial [Rotaria sordida]
SAGSVLIHNVEFGQIIDHEIYIENCLQPIIDEIKKRRPLSSTHSLKILHDNGKPHIHKAVSDYLTSEDVTIIPDPSDSPDLAP